MRKLRGFKSHICHLPDRIRMTGGEKERGIERAEREATNPCVFGVACEFSATAFSKTRLFSLVLGKGAEKVGLGLCVCFAHECKFAIQRVRSTRSTWLTGLMVWWYHIRFARGRPWVQSPVGPCPQGSSPPRCRVSWAVLRTGWAGAMWRAVVPSLCSSCNLLIC